MTAGTPGELAGDSWEVCRRFAANQLKIPRGPAGIDVIQTGARPRRNYTNEL
jgi:hypothetical protein